MNSVNSNISYKSFSRSRSRQRRSPYARSSPNIGYSRRHRRRHISTQHAAAIAEAPRTRELSDDKLSKNSSIDAEKGADGDQVATTWCAKHGWIVAALFAFVLNGVANFFLGLATSAEQTNAQADMAAMLPDGSDTMMGAAASTPSALVASFPEAVMLMVAFGSGLVAIPYGILFYALREASRREFLEQMKKSRAVLANVIASCCNYGAIIALGIAFALDPGGKGVTSSVTAANCLLVALVARLWLKEMLTRVHVFGMLISVAGVVTISFGSSAAGSLTSFGFGVLAMLLFALTTLLIKYSSVKEGANAKASSFVVIATQGVIGIVYAIVQGIRGVPLEGSLDSNSVLLALGSGIVLRLATIAMTIGIVLGLAGPTSAIALTNGILVLLLDVTILGLVPNDTKIVGMFVALAGVVILTLSHQIVSVRLVRRMCFISDDAAQARVAATKSEEDAATKSASLK